MTPFWFMYRPIASGVWSLCHDVENTYGEHSSPESGEAPALVSTAMVLLSTSGLSDAKQHVRPDIAGDEIDLVGFDQLAGLLHADFGFLLVVLVNDLDRQAAELAAVMVKPELEALRMSLPMAAVGPLNVLMKPILTVFCWAMAGPATSASAAAAAIALYHCVHPSDCRRIGVAAFP